MIRILRAQVSRRRHGTLYPSNDAPKTTLIKVHQFSFQRSDSLHKSNSPSIFHPSRNARHDHFHKSCQTQSNQHNSRLFSTLPKKKEKVVKGASKVEQKGRTIEEQYSRKTPLEHILLRPGMYIGPTEQSPPSPLWIPRPVPSSPQPSSEAISTKESVTNTIQMVREKVPHHPALVKLLDEILVNAFDNRLRHGSKKSTTQIDVVIEPGSGKIKPFISVTNNGKGIPVTIHKKEGIYVPEMLFGHLLTGSNFDDSNQKQVTGGRHGYGAKLTNIFSKKFELETVDSTRQKKYTQKWENNMRVMHDAEVVSLKEKDLPEGGDYTRITFVPDIPKVANGSLHLDVNNAIPPEDYAIMSRRVYDMAGCGGGKLKVTLNGKVLPIFSFRDYIELFRPSSSPNICYQKINSRWEVGIGLSSSGSFENISFVNGMDTSRGGTHVNAIVQQVTKRIVDKVTKDYSELADTVSQAMVRRHLCVFVNCLIENPSFDSQMKESLTSSPSSFGSNYTLSETYFKKLLKDEQSGGPGIIEEVITAAQGRQQASLLRLVGGKKKTKRQLLNIPKLDDAHLAGSGDGHKCTLIITEGDSAKALAVAGLEVVGRELYGVFPLRGKFLNVRDASVSQLSKNKEVKALSSILGLDFETNYDTVRERSELRYGHIMLMTDQDTDGSHIKGLVINFFRHFWPKLLIPPVDCPEEKAFFSSFVTPLLKAFRKSSGKVKEKTFYSLPEYNKWRSSLSGGEISRWKIKYYKGLGTSTQAEAKTYFRNFANHKKIFQWDSEEDGHQLDMVFEKDRAGDRRDWLLNSEHSTASDDFTLEDPITFKDFVNLEMIQFSHSDNIRSIPSVIDGLKPSQRKVLYACFKRNLKQEIKVAQLAGYCAEHTAYHHGEASLQSTIIGMAQNFVGSNNINLLVPSGQFGTRLLGGKDAASPRYIFTELTKEARLLFPEVDDPLLNYMEDDGTLIEPDFYCPIIPLLLVNGSQGIGTGWSTFIPQHNVRDIINYIRAKIKDESTLPIINPWVKGFSGILQRRDDSNGYKSVGKVKKQSRTSVIISELPIGRWTNDYKELLSKMLGKGEIQGFVENHSTNSVSFTVEMRSVQLQRMEKTGLEKVFKLESNLLMTNMHAFGPDRNIRKYSSPDMIADDFFPIRNQLYHDRKRAVESSKEYAAAIVRNKAQFIEMVVDGSINLINADTSKLDTIHALRDLNFDSQSELETIKCKESDSTALDHPKKTSRNDEKEFDYLLNLPLQSLTSDKINSFQAENLKTEKELHVIRGKTPEDLWLDDLDRLENHISKHYNIE